MFFGSACPLFGSFCGFGVARYLFSKACGVLFENLLCRARVGGSGCYVLGEFVGLSDVRFSCFVSYLVGPVCTGFSPIFHKLTRQFSS
jgi:hypothetical protein